MSLNESTPNPSKQAPDILLSMPKASRRLAVVLAARIPGPCPTERTESQGANDGACDVRRDLIEPTLAENRGTLVRWTGGDLLALFESPYAAAHCALVLDNLFRSRNSRLSMRNRGGCRIGLGLGDVLVQSNAIHGDAVTIAERLAGLARPGEVYVPGGVHEQISNRLVCKCRALGEITLAGMPGPVRVYALSRIAVVGEKRLGLPRARNLAAAAAATVMGGVLGLAVVHGPQFIQHPAFSTAQAQERTPVREWADPRPVKARALNR